MSVKIFCEQVVVGKGHFDQHIKENFVEVAWDEDFYVTIKPNKIEELELGFDKQIAKTIAEMIKRTTEREEDFHFIVNDSEAWVIASREKRGEHDRKKGEKLKPPYITIFAKQMGLSYSWTAYFNMLSWALLAEALLCGVEKCGVPAETIDDIALDTMLDELKTDDIGQTLSIRPAAVDMRPISKKEARRDVGGAWSSSETGFPDG